MDPNPTQEQLDRATSQRLGRLRSMPVDTSRLDAIIEVQIPRRARGRIGEFFRLGAVRAACLVVILGLIAWIVWSQSGSSVLASPPVLARFHEELLRAQSDAKPVDSIADANKILADDLKGLQIPQFPDAQAIRCMIGAIGDKRIACVLLDSDGVPLTMAVANAMDVRVPESQRRIEKGTEYHITTSGKLHMVMGERHGRWICLISELPVDRLLEIIEKVEL